MRTIQLHDEDADFLKAFLMRQRYLPDEREPAARCVAALIKNFERAKTLLLDLADERHRQRKEIKKLQSQPLDSEKIAEAVMSRLERKNLDPSAFEFGKKSASISHQKDQPNNESSIDLLERLRQRVEAEKELARSIGFQTPDSETLLLNDALNEIELLINLLRVKVLCLNCNTVYTYVRGCEDRNTSHVCKEEE